MSDPYNPKHQRPPSAAELLLTATQRVDDLSRAIIAKNMGPAMLTQHREQLRVQTWRIVDHCMHTDTNTRSATDTSTAAHRLYNYHSKLVGEVASQAFEYIESPSLADTIMPGKTLYLLDTINRNGVLLADRSRLAAATFYGIELTADSQDVTTKILLPNKDGSFTNHTDFESSVDQLILQVAGEGLARLVVDKIISHVIPALQSTDR